MLKRKRPTDPAQQNAKNNTDDKLQAILGNGKKTSKSLTLLIAGGALLLVGAVVGGYLFFSGSKETANETVYREYAVERGDIVVGLTESSSISLKRETITFPVSSTVEEIFVKAGSSVKEGDPLVRMNMDEIEASIKSYDLQLEIAGLELERSKLQLDTKLLQAKQQLESSKQDGSLASDQKSTTLSELQLALTKAENSLLEAKEELANYTSMSATFERDYRKLTELEDEVEYWQEQVSDAQSDSGDSQSYLSSLKSSQTQAGTMLEAIGKMLDGASTQIDSTVDSAEDYAKKMVTYNNYVANNTVEAKFIEALAGANPADVDGILSNLDYLQGSTMSQADFDLNKEAYKSQLTKLQNAASSVRSGTNEQTRASNNLSSYQYSLSNAQAVYNDFKDYYTQTYGNITDAETIAKKIMSLETDVEQAKLNIEKAELSSKTGSMNAEQQRESAANEASSAATLYELTEMELAQAVDKAQEAYDDLLTQIEDAKALINEDGIVYAPCNGMVSSISVEVGDSVKVTYDTETRKISQYAQLLAMTNISDVYVPVTISEEDILSVSIGQKATVSMNAFPDKRFDAVVESISAEAARIGAATISYTVTVLFSETNELDMYEGMIAEVTLIQMAALDVLYINSSAVTTLDGVSTVLVKGADGEGVPTNVKTGFSDGRYVEITSGLNEGDTVLMESAVGSMPGGSTSTRGGQPDTGAGGNQMIRMQ